jgi:hypothetical protein
MSAATNSTTPFSAAAFATTFAASKFRSAAATFVAAHATHRAFATTASLASAFGPFASGPTAVMTEEAHFSVLFQLFSSKFGLYRLIAI